MVDKVLRPQAPWEVRRKIALPGIADANDAVRVEKLLTGVPGVRAVKVEVSKQMATVRYEITETDYRTLGNTLKRAGFPPLDSWWARRKTIWYQNLDLTSRDNASVRPSACCNKPPGSTH